MSVCLNFRFEVKVYSTRKNKGGSKSWKKETKVKRPHHPRSLVCRQTACELPKLTEIQGTCIKVWQSKKSSTVSHQSSLVIQIYVSNESKIYFI